MKFFTDRTVVNDYLLIKIVDYWKLKYKNEETFERWKEVFIEPGVYDLTKDCEYSWVTKMSYNFMGQWIKNLPANHYFSWDYPCDMNPQFTDYFLRKSWENALEYSKYPQYIVTVQSKFHDYMSFVEWFDKYNALDIKSGILGLGNICRLFYRDQYIKNTLLYAFKKCRHQKIHIYGLTLRLISYANSLAKKYGIELSIDSTKWIHACNNELSAEFVEDLKVGDLPESFLNYIKNLINKWKERLK